MTDQIFGKLIGDKGYISKALADLLWGNGIQMTCYFIPIPVCLMPDCGKWLQLLSYL
jgi:hypothetical protein